MKGGPKIDIHLNYRHEKIIGYRIISAFDDEDCPCGPHYNFTSFVNVILEAAKMKKCQLSTNCDINAHWRYVRSLLTSLPNHIEITFTDPSTTTVISVG